MDDSQLFPDTSSYYKKSAKRPKGIIVVVFLLLLFITGIFLGIRYFGGEQRPQIQGLLPTTPTPTLIPSPTTEPTAAEEKDDPTPTASKTTGTITPSISPTGTTASGRKALSVAVENGSGVSGAAAGIARDLRTLGYNVVSTGNADAFDYEDVTIQVKATKKGMLETLKKDLSEDYTITEATADLTGSTADALVIIGK